jgi:hypothetical protein
MGVTQRNADCLEAIPFTEEQKYLFDTRGWLAIPGVLSAEETRAAREHCVRLHQDRESLPAKHRSSIGGPLERLTDHPLVLGFMNEFLAYAPLATDDGYGFRLENSFLSYRVAGSGKFQPHGGSGFHNFPGNSHEYHMVRGRAHSGLTRVVWELNPVERRKGSTLFLTGSHKAAFPRPASTDNEDSPLWETYECPEGSVLFFTEAITHTAAHWTSETDRVAVFSCYNVIGSKWHEWEPHPEHLAEMPPLRQSLFRSVYCQNNSVGPGYRMEM